MKIAAIAVAMPAALADGLDRECAELAHISPFPHFSPHDRWDTVAFYGPAGQFKGSIIRTSIITLPMIPHGTLWESVVAERAEL